MHLNVVGHIQQTIPFQYLISERKSLQNPLEYNDQQILQVILHPYFFSKYQLDGQGGHTEFVGDPQQQLKHLQLFAVHVLHKQQHKFGSEIQIFLIETYPSFLLDDVNFRFEQSKFSVENAKCTVLISQGILLQNPFDTLQLVLGIAELNSYSF
ncbi:unnamed protein product [Paramecium octaurelia]|uniref:Uncharacterized protein n=1 Tax=Paramecium octaurelia TaxID=43137 RepID=A0A8S1X187_PAROT|nr:unnamed protein product [Paramecium octaurelia]